MTERFQTWKKFQYFIGKLSSCKSISGIVGKNWPKWPASGLRHLQFFSIFRWGPENDFAIYSNIHGGSKIEKQCSNVLWMSCSGTAAPLDFFFKNVDFQPLMQTALLNCTFFWISSHCDVVHLKQQEGKFYSDCIVMRFLRGLFWPSLCHFYSKQNCTRPRLDYVIG